jgi:AraC-like DNA-binding protein
MNFTLDENNSFEQLISNVCDKISNSKYKVKKEFGIGSISIVKIIPGVEFLYFEMKLLDPIIVKWEYRDTNNKLFYLNHVESINADSTKDYNFALAEEGTTLISQNNNRHILWLPSIQYKIFSYKFSFEWLNKIDELMILPKNAKSFISGHLNLLLLHVNKNGGIKQVTNQIFKYKELVNEDSQNIYLHSKLLELLLLIFQVSLPISSEKKAKDSVHIDDYNNIINFADEFSAKGIIPDKIEVVADNLGMSRSKFQRVFKLVKGQTYYNFVLDIRMVKAMEMLMDSKSVTDISHITGYSAISNFTHAFKNYFNILPSDITAQP